MLRRIEAELNFMEATMRRTPFNLQVGTKECTMTHTVEVHPQLKNVTGVAEYDFLLYTYGKEYVMA